MGNMWSRKQTDPPVIRSADQDLERGIPLENVRPFSSETQRRNGERRSKALDHGTRIMENIDNLSYDCPICFDEILRGAAMWDCKKCYQVFHHSCIQEWVRSDHNNSHGIRTWDCPTCKYQRTRMPESTCWCGSEPFRNLAAVNGHPPNSCGRERCRNLNRTTCTHAYVCGKGCHAGPCSKCPKCPENTKIAAIHRDDNPPIPPTLRERMRNKMRATLDQGAKPAKFILAISPKLIPLAILHAILVMWLVLYIKRYTEPYNYPDFIFDRVYKKNKTAIICLFLFVIVPLNVNLSLRLIAQIHVAADVDHMSEPHKKSIAVLALLFLPLMWGWPILSFSLAPQAIWFETMRHSCDGFDTRISTLDHLVSWSFYHGWVSAPKAKLFLHKPEETTFLPPLYISSHVHDTSYSGGNYESFFRISGSTPKTKHLAVDFDFSNRVWRMLQLNKTEEAHSFPAEKFSKTTTVFHDQNSNLTLIKEGTWSKSTSKKNHTLIIPELDLRVPHWWEFTQNFAFEPFLKVHRTTNMSAEEIENLAHKKWTKDNEKSVLMRTAAFGHGQERTSVCIKNGDWTRNANKIGLGDDMLVPLGLLQAYRLRMYSEGLRGFDYTSYAWPKQKILT